MLEVVGETYPPRPVRQPTIWTRATASAMVEDPSVERLPYILVIAAWAYVTLGHLLPEVLGPRGVDRARPVA